MSFEKEMEDREDPAYEAYMECMVTEVKPRDEMKKTGRLLDCFLP